MRKQVSEAPKHRSNVCAAKKQNHRIDEAHYVDSKYFFRVMLWYLKFPPISSTQSIFLLQRVIWSFCVCRSSPNPRPPRPDPRSPPQTTCTHHAKREANAIDCGDGSSGEDLERRPSLTPPCSVANTTLISRSLQLPSAPSQGVAQVACCATASGRHLLLHTSPDIEPGRQGRPT
jgi:hypothetical protein